MNYRVLENLKNQTTVNVDWEYETRRFNRKVLEISTSSISKDSRVASACTTRITLEELGEDKEKGLLYAVFLDVNRAVFEKQEEALAPSMLTSLFRDFVGSGKEEADRINQTYYLEGVVEMLESDIRGFNDLSKLISYLSRRIIEVDGDSSSPRMRFSSIEVVPEGVRYFNSKVPSDGGLVELPSFNDLQVSFLEFLDDPYIEKVSFSDRLYEALYDFHGYICYSYNNGLKNLTEREKGNPLFDLSEDERRKAPFRDLGIWWFAASPISEEVLEELPLFFEILKELGLKMPSTSNRELHEALLSGEGSTVKSGDSRLFASISKCYSAAHELGLLGAAIETAEKLNAGSI